MIRTLGFLLLMAAAGYGQTVPQKVFEPKLEKNKLSVFDNTGNLVFEKFFNDPAELFVNLGSGKEGQYLIRDKKNFNGITKYSAFIYNVRDTFYLIDSLYSGVYEPAPFYSTELERTILLTGNPDFDSLYSTIEQETFSAVTCLMYDEGQLYNVNDQVYDIFLQENEPIISYVESSWSGSGKDCSATKEMRSALGAVYLNYLNAGEKVLARQFLNDYYLCPDKESFKNFLDSQF